MGRELRSLEERFWTKVNKSSDAKGCWLWTASLKNGYGHLGKGRRGEGNLYAHRLSYEMHHGPIPEGLEVCHSCDVRACVNPAHLFADTHRGNLLDMCRKGRHNSSGNKKGEQHYNARLTEAAVRDIRNSSGKLAIAAKRYGITISTASRIRRRESWTHVE